MAVPLGKGNRLRVSDGFFEAKKFGGYLICEAKSVLGAIFAHEKIWWNNSEVFVEEMFVAPERQRSGLGTALLNEIEKYRPREKACGDYAFDEQIRARAAFL